MRLLESMTGAGYSSFYAAVLCWRRASEKKDKFQRKFRSFFGSVAFKLIQRVFPLWRKDMDCKEFQKNIHRYLDGELADVDAERFASHERHCELCSHQAEELRAVSKMFEEDGLAAEFAVPEVLRAKTLRAFQEEVQENSVPSWWSSLSTGLRSGVMATAVVGLLLGVALGSTLSATLTPTSDRSLLYVALLDENVGELP